MLDALHMDVMMKHVDSWRRDPESFLKEHGLNTEHSAESDDDEEVFVLIVEGFLIFNHRYKRETSITVFCFYCKTFQKFHPFEKLLFLLRRGNFPKSFFFNLMKLNFPI